MKLFNFDIHIGRWRVLVQTRDIADRAITAGKIAERAIQWFHIALRAIRNEHIDDQAVDTRTLADKAVTARKLADELAHEIEKIASLQNQIDSLEISGVAVSNEFGSNPHIAVSQKTITGAFNVLYQILEELTGRTLRGISLNVTPSYFTDDTCIVHITANTVMTNGVFEHIAVYANGELLTEADNADYLEHTAEIADTTVIKCVARILGIEYTRESTITKRPALWLGAGDSYSDVYSASHLVTVKDGLRAARDVRVNDGDHIIILMADSLRDSFFRADINGVEIHFIESAVTLDGKRYCVFVSENVYTAGTYNIDING